MSGEGSSSKNIEASRSEGTRIRKGERISKKERIFKVNREKLS